jgi:putative ABC transport system permease protein
MTPIVQDIRYAARLLRNAPSFTAVAVLTLALGIGATVAVYSIVYGVLIKPLPYTDPSRLMLVTSAQKGQPSYMSPPDLLDYRSMNRTLSGLAGIGDVTVNLTRSGAEPMRLGLGRVSANFFDVLGVRAALGRTFAADADRTGAPKVIVLGYGTWRDEFAGDSAVIGRTITLDGDPWTVIGVAPSWLRYPRGVQGWVPLQLREWERNPSSRGSHEFRGVGRLKDGVTVAQADQDLRDVAARLATQYPQTNTGFSAGVWALQDQMVQGSRKALLTLLAAVAFVLLVACANVANLLLVRATAREGEMAVRSALGAGRWDLVRQLLAESLLLAATGTAAGALLAGWVVDAVVAYGPKGLPRLDEVGVDGRVLLFAAGTAVGTAILFGLAPALHAATPNLSGVLHASARRAGGRRGAQRIRNTLVVVETALAVVLLVGAGLFLRSFARMVGVDPGFTPDNIAAVTLSLPGLRYPKDHQVGAFADRLLERLRAQPGVTDAALGFGRPLADEYSNTSFEVRGEPPSTPTTRRVAYFRPVSPTYFHLLGVPLLAGRMFTDADRVDAPQVMIVNREFVRRFYHGRSPLGKFVVLGWGRDTAEWGADTVVGGTIVGVVPDLLELRPGAQPQPITYVPFVQSPIGDIFVMVRSSLPLATALAETRAAVRAVDADLPVYGETSLRGALAQSVSQPRFYVLLLSAFSGIALLLAALGIYGVISYGVSTRVREIGIRIALGATRARVMTLTIRQGVALALIGIPIGLVAAYWLTRLVVALLFNPGAADAVAFAVAALVLLATATLASYLPARRAAAIDPAVTMRAE